MTVLMEWLSREGLIVLGWWLWITLAGVAVFPLCMRLLSGLPDKGYTLSRAVGMMLVTFVFWLLASYGFLDNSVGSIILSWLIVVIVSLLIYVRLGDVRDIFAWWRENRLLFVVTEILFFGLFFIWVIYRAHQNQILFTEKPMELAFMSAVQRSDTFPPNDPWMSGYAISYYYMGYVMSSMLSMLNGISSTIGFNLTIASQFALTGLTAFGVVYNLVRSRAFESMTQFRNSSASNTVAISVGLLGMLFMVLMGNFQGVLIEAPYQSKSMPQSYFEFWGTQERANFGENAYLQDTDSVLLDDAASWSSWWWFRASRVLTDYNLDNTLPPSYHAQPIDEFPAFSFLLADNHPHVLGLPFVVMVIGLMLNLLLTGRDPNRYEVLLYGVAVGALLFLNTWDSPMYLVGLVGADAVRRLMQQDKGRLDIEDWLHLVKLGFVLAGILVIAYLPFLIGFRSQAGGVLPNLLHPTAFRRFFIMLGPFVIILPVFLMTEAWRGMKFREMNWRAGFSTGGLVLLGLLLITLVLTALSVFIPTIQNYIQGFLNEWGGWDVVIPLLLQRRVEYGLTSLLLLLAIVLVVARLFPNVRKAKFDDNADGINVTYPSATGFALLLIGMGVMLTLIPEFFYLKDNFSTRINTIFKFYYQTWAVWSIAGAYAVYSVIGDSRIRQLRLSLRLIFGVIVVVVLVGGVMYSVFGIYHRSWIESGRNQTPSSRIYSPPQDWDNPVRLVSEGVRVVEGTILYSDGNLNENPQAFITRSSQAGIVSIQGEDIVILPLLTLDGGSTMIDRDDYNVVTCLNNLVDGDDAVVAEAVRDAYNAQYGRVGALTGIPIVLGWENHERQWRGLTYADVVGTRREDLDKLYSHPRMDAVIDIIEKYDITYILFGSTERAQYSDTGETKFISNLPIVCESDDSRVFFVDRKLELSEIR
jgi:YYY domain-containing protein